MYKVQYYLRFQASAGGLGMCLPWIKGLQSPYKESKNDAERPSNSSKATSLIAAGPLVSGGAPGSPCHPGGMG